MRILRDNRKGLLLKEQRVTYWEKNHRIPTVHDLMKEISRR